MPVLDAHGFASGSFSPSKRTTTVLRGSLMAGLALAALLAVAGTATGTPLTGISTGEGESVSLGFTPITGVAGTITSGPLPVASGSAPAAYSVTNTAASATVAFILSTGLLNVDASSNVDGTVNVARTTQAAATVNALSIAILGALGISANTVASTASISGNYNSLVAAGSTTITGLSVAGLSAFGATISPAVNDVILNALGLTVTLNKQTVTGNAVTGLSMITDGIDVQFLDVAATINGQLGYLSGSIDIAVSEADMTAGMNGIPEPSSMSAMGMGLAALGVFRRKIRLLG